MERNFAIATIFTLLFAVSTARISLDTKPTEAYLPQCDTESLPGDLNNLVALPTETKSTSDQTDQKSDNDRTFRVDLRPRSEFARFHAINRRFSDHRRFQNPFVTPRSEISNGNELILNTHFSKSDARSFYRHESSRLNFKHEHERHHRRQHQHQHHHNHNHHNNDHVSMPKHKFVRENTKSNLFHEKKTREHEASSFMKSIRKFLKHTFD